jgi:hypothetical protein
MAKPINPQPRRPLRTASVAAAVACGLVVSFIVCLGGCRAVDNAQVDVMERELRQQEDYIYELEDAVMTYSEKLRQYRTCEAPMTLNALPTKAKTPKGGPTIADDSALESPPTRRQGRKLPGRPDAPLQTPPPAIDAFELPPTLPAPVPSSTPATAPAAAPQTAPVVPRQFEPPNLEIGPTSDLKLKWKGAAPIATAPAGDEAPPFIPDPADYQIDADASPLAADHASVDRGADAALPAIASEPPELIAPMPELTPAADPARLTARRLEIRRVLGPSPSADALAGSLLVVVEALNATNEPVDANGEMSLMVMSGASQEALKRIDRWDFTAEETQAAWQSSQLGDGLHLELPLGEGPLPDGQLELWARLVNADGEKLLTKTPFAAGDLRSLEQALAEAPQPENTAATAASESPGAEPQPLGANGEAVADGESLNAAAPAPAAAPRPAKTQWRASSEPLSPERVQAYASTTGGISGGWTKQPPGREPVPTPSRVATETGGRPRWQQGSNETPQVGEAGGAWAPFR